MNFKTITIISLLAITLTAYGQEDNSERKLIFDIGADLVSSYVWRGWYLAGPSIQPAMNLSAYGITVGAWGSKDFSTIEKEIDFFIAYEIKGFSIGFADYWMMHEEAPYFRNKGNHLFEGSLGYTFPEKFPLSLEISTLFAGDEDVNENGQKYFSTYISACFPFSVRDVNIEAGIGVSPWKGMYSNQFDVATISVKATKELRPSAEYALPVFAELIVAPAQNGIFFVFGINF